MTSRIQLGHGGGGRLSRALIDEEIVARFGRDTLQGLPDAATLTPRTGALRFSTDSFVVQPWRFPGGNIGDLAVHGTVNDLAVSGATPRWLSLALILEEGLAIDTLRTVLDSVAAAAADCGVSIVTGDTKVVRRGQADGLYINTAGVGEAIDGFRLDESTVTVRDHVLVSGPIGDHGMAVLCAREGIDFENGPVSDTGPVHRLVGALQPYAEAVRFMRDPTRGGVATVLNEIVEHRDVGIELSEADIPRSTGTRAAAELLGLDLLDVACEGRMLAIVAPDVADDVLAAWRALPEGRGATRIGVVGGTAGRVTLRTTVGGRRIVAVPQGELLPRIC